MLSLFGFRPKSDESEGLDRAARSMDDSVCCGWNATKRLEVATLQLTKRKKHLKT